MKTPELDYISIEGFKSIAKIERLSLHPINVIIGPNGSGKSNFIGVFSFLKATHSADERTAEKIDEYVRKAGGANRLLHFGAKVTKRIHIAVSFRGMGAYAMTLQLAANDELEKTTLLIARDDKATSSGILKWGRECVDRWRVYHLHDTSASSPMRTTAKLNDNEFFRSDGSNLPAFLYLLMKKYPDQYQIIRRIIQQIAPFFDDFRLRPDPLNEDSIRLEWAHLGTDEYFDAASFSDGTLRFIALATLLLQPKELRPSVVLIDEPELGLHPHAITIFASLVKQVSRETQVILSTQSPLLLDHFQPEDVLVANRIDESTTLTRLDSAKLDSWLEDYSLGQLWEKNELGGRPRKG